MRKTHTARYFVVECISPRVVPLILLAGMATLLASDLHAAHNVSVPVREWNVLGPLGDPGLIEVGKLHQDRNRRNAARRLAHKVITSAIQKYEPENVVDLDATYRGGVTRDSAGNDYEVKWQSLDVAGEKGVFDVKGDAKAEFPLVNGYGTYYFSTWVYAPDALEITLQFPAYGNSTNALNASDCFCWLNGKPLKHAVRKSETTVRHPVRGQKVQLKKGWNHLYCRQFSISYWISHGCVLEVPEAVAFDVKFSADPPENVGRKFKLDGTPVKED